jgi:signal transduction histidine kinase
MLHEFIELNRDVIIARTRDRVRQRSWPSVASDESEFGVPLFLTQLAETLRAECTTTPFPSDAIGAAAARRGRDLLDSGFSVSQVVHDYGDICQAVTALAVEQRAPIRTLAEVRLEAGRQTRTRLSVATFIDEIVATGLLHAADRNVQLTTDTVDASLSIDADPQLLGSAVMNVLHNAFKNTPPGRRVKLRAYAEHGRLLIETEDACGGIPQDDRDLFRAFGDRRGRDRSGLGLGLSIARKAVRAHDGEIRVRDLPGQGCIFTIDIPLTSTDAPPAP